MSTKRESLWTNWGFFIEEDILWFVPYEINILCKADLVTRQVEKVISFPNMSTERAGVYNVRRCGDYIVTVPAIENSIYLYNMISEEVTTVPLKREYYYYEKFFACSEWNGCVYFLPRYYNSMLRLSLSECTLMEISRLEHNSPFCDYLQIEQKIYMVDTSGHIVVFNMETEAYEHIEICGTESFNSITLYEDAKIVVSNSCGIVYIYDLVSRDIEKVEVAREGNFSEIICVEDNLYLFPKTDSEKIIVFHMKERNRDTIYLDNTLSQNDLYDGRWGVFSEPLLEKNNIYVMNACNRCLYMIDVISNKATEVHLELDEMSREQGDYFIDFMQTVGGICEGDEPYAKIDYFITKTNKKPENDKQMVGKRIFESLKDLL